MSLYIAALVSSYAAILTAEKEEGQGLVEYALIIVLVSIAAIAVLGLLGTEIKNSFNAIITGLKSR